MLKTDAVSGNAFGMSVNSTEELKFDATQLTQNAYKNKIHYAHTKSTPISTFRRHDVHVHCSHASTLHFIMGMGPQWICIQYACLILPKTKITQELRSSLSEQECNFVFTCNNLRIRTEWNIGPVVCRKVQRGRLLQCAKGFPHRIKNSEIWIRILLYTISITFSTLKQHYTCT